MTRNESEKYIKSKMCNDCSVHLGGGKCSDNCKVIEAIKALEKEPCDDVIRREAVEDIRRALLFWADNFMTTERINNTFNRFLEGIEQEVEPKLNTEHWRRIGIEI